MSDSARVTSIEAVEDFKAHLSGFCEEVKEALTQAQMEVRHTIDRILRDYASYWKKALRDRQDDLAQAKNELARKQMQGFQSEDKPDIVQERKAVRKAQERLQEAEEKIENCRRWGTRELPRALEEFSGPCRQLESMVQGDPPTMIIHLGKILDSLDSYVGLAPPISTGPAPTAATTPAASAKMPASAATAPAATPVAPVEPAPEQPAADAQPEPQPAEHNK